MKNIREFLERRVDMPMDGFIIETPYINPSRAAKYETSGIRLLRSTGRPKFYASTSKELGYFISRFTSSNDMNQGRLNKNDDRIIIYPADGNINDSVHESYDYLYENERNNTPLQKRKQQIINLVLSYDIPRTEEDIRAAFEKLGPWTAEWNSKSELKHMNHIKYVLKKTEMLKQESDKDIDDNVDNDIDSDIDDNININNNENNNDDDNTENLTMLDRIAMNAPRKTLILSVVYSNDEGFEQQTEATALISKYRGIFKPSTKIGQKYAKYFTYKFKVFNGKGVIAFITYPDIPSIRLYLGELLYDKFFLNSITNFKDYLDEQGVMYDGEFEADEYAQTHIKELFNIALDYGVFTEIEYRDDQLDDKNGDFMTMEEFIDDQEEYRKIMSGYYDDIKDDGTSNFNGFVDD